MLASAYQEIGSFDRALSTFEPGARAEPRQREYRGVRIGVLVAAKRFPEALERSQAWLATHPNDVRVTRLRAEALRGAGRADEAVRLLEQALAAQPDEVTDYLALSEMYAVTSAYDAAARTPR